MHPTLPQRIYLLSYDADRGRFDPLSTAYRGQLLRAAALAELTITGLVGDRDGKAVRNAGAPPADPFLAEVLADVPRDRPRGRLGLLQRGMIRAESAVREPLARAGTITVTRRRVLGLIPAGKVTVDRPDEVRELRERARAALFAGGDPAAAPIEDAAAAAIAVAGDMLTVFGLAERRRYPAEIASLNARVDAAAPGILRAVHLAVAATRSAST